MSFSQAPSIDTASTDNKLAMTELPMLVHFEVAGQKMPVLSYDLQCKLMNSPDSTGIAPEPEHLRHLRITRDQNAIKLLYESILSMLRGAVENTKTPLILLQGLNLPIARKVFDGFWKAGK